VIKINKSIKNQISEYEGIEKLKNHLGEIGFLEK